MTDDDAGAGCDGDPGPGSEDGTPISRRWLIRLLVGLGVGIPVAIEGATFAGLIGDRLSGDDATDPTTTTRQEGVGEGDELLADTEPTERLTAARVTAGDDRWQLVLSVRVENTTATEYALALGAVTTAGGETVDGETTTGRIAPGESAFVTGTWRLPAGATPASVGVVATSYGDSTERRRRQVPLRRIPVER